MNKFTNFHRSPEEPFEPIQKGIKYFEKQLVHLKRFNGTLYDASHLIKRKLNDPNNKKVAFVSTKEELYENYQDTWEKARALPLSERQFPDAISITVLYLYVDGFRLEFRDGRPFTIPDVNSLFTEKDLERCKTISNYLKADETGLKPKSITRKLRLLQMIDLVTRTYDAVCSFTKK